MIALVGPLGAGKTLLTRAIVEGLGGDPRQVASPTFGLVHEYAARWPVYHFDAYRLPNERALVELGIDEYFAAGGVCIVEWADRFPGVLPDEYLSVTIETTGQTCRRISMMARGERYEALLGGMGQ